MKIPLYPFHWVFYSFWNGIKQYEQSICDIQQNNLGCFKIMRCWRKYDIMIFLILRRNKKSYMEIIKRLIRTVTIYFFKQHLHFYKLIILMNEWILSWTSCTSQGNLEKQPSIFGGNWHRQNMHRNEPALRIEPGTLPAASLCHHYDKGSWLKFVSQTNVMHSFHLELSKSSQEVYSLVGNLRKAFWMKLPWSWLWRYQDCIKLHQEYC